jgi:hypothetical protein
MISQKEEEKAALKEVKVLLEHGAGADVFEHVYFSSFPGTDNNAKHFLLLSLLIPIIILLFVGAIYKVESSPFTKPKARIYIYESIWMAKTRLGSNI